MLIRRNNPRNEMDFCSLLFVPLYCIFCSLSVLCLLLLFTTTITTITINTTMYCYEFSILYRPCFYTTLFITFSFRFCFLVLSLDCKNRVQPRTAMLYLITARRTRGRLQRARESDKMKERSRQTNENETPTVRTVHGNLANQPTNRQPV